MYPNATGKVCLESPKTSWDQKKDETVGSIASLYEMLGRNPIVVLLSQGLATEKGGPHFIERDQV
jgi:hypothetical protein